MQFKFPKHSVKTSRLYLDIPYACKVFSPKQIFFVMCKKDKNSVLRKAFSGPHTHFGAGSARRIIRRPQANPCAQGGYRGCRRKLKIARASLVGEGDQYFPPKQLSPPLFPPNCPSKSLFPSRDASHSRHFPPRHALRRHAAQEDRQVRRSPSCPRRHGAE